MPRRRELLVLALTAGLVWIITLSPLVLQLIQVVRTPPAQHPELVVIGILGDGIERLLWIVGVAAVVLAVRVVGRMIRTGLTRKSGRMRNPHLFQERLSERRTL